MTSFNYKSTTKIIGFGMTRNEYEFCKKIQHYGDDRFLKIFDCSEINGDFRVSIENFPNNYDVVNDLDGIITDAAKETLLLVSKYFKDKHTLAECLSWWLGNMDITHLTKFSNPLAITIKFAGLSEDIPKKGTPDSSGYDIKSKENYTVQPGEICQIKTGLKINSYPLRSEIRDRSSMAKQGWRVCGGIIDRDYRGEIQVLLQNTTNSEKTISKGDRIAQLIFYNHIDVNFNHVYQLENTERGIGGFGSTGK